MRRLWPIYRSIRRQRGWLRVQQDIIFVACGAAIGR
jgi:hypothetical protein